MTKIPAIESFSGEYHFLSNFYRCRVFYDMTEYPTAEHAFQCQKPLILSDRQRILFAATPSEAKRIARGITMRPGWNEIKVDIMKNVLRAKFTPWFLSARNPLAIRLIQTGDAELIEGNTWGDTFWGQCPIGNGENILGKLLMKVRQEISHAG